MSEKFSAQFNPAKGIDGVFEYAEEVELFVNQIDTTKSQRDELVNVLDAAAATQYSYKPVLVSGIYQQNLPQGSLNPEVQTELVAGIVEGLSYGFTIARIEDLEPPADAEYEQQQLFNSIVQASLGEFAVSHLVTLTKKNFVADHHAFIHNIMYMAVAPIMTSSLYGPAATEINIAQHSPEESMRVLQTLDKFGRRQLEDIWVDLYREDEPIANLITASSKVKRLLNSSSAPIKNALMAHLTHLYDDYFKIHQFVTDSFPYVLWPSDDNSKHYPTKLSGVDEFIFAVRGLRTDPHYFVDGKGEIIRKSSTKDMLSLSADAIIATSAHGTTQEFVIPIEHLDPQKIKAVKI